MNLKPCPCGEVPKKLNAFWEDGEAWQSGIIKGDCCEEWAICVYREDWKPVKQELETASPPTSSKP